MVRMYRPKAGSLHPGLMSDGALRDIGRIVRACADIEDLVTLRICKLVDLDEPTVTAILGRAPLVRRLKTLEYFESISGKRALTRHRGRFGSAYDQIMETRNVVAHGSFIGLDEQDRYCFLTDISERPEAGEALKRVVSASETAISAFARDAEKLAVSLCWRLRLRPWRDIRFQQPLRRYRNKVQSAGKRQRPPRSSRA